jgi:hypothetical protein
MRAFMIVAFATILIFSAWANHANSAGQPGAPSATDQGY